MPARCQTCSARPRASSKAGSLFNDRSPGHQRLHYFVRQRDSRLIARWHSIKATDIALCSVVVYELRYGAERSSNPARGHAKLDLFLSPFTSLTFDDRCARTCAEIRAELERTGRVIGPDDLQIAAIALQHELILVTHNRGEFSRIAGLKLEDWEACFAKCASQPTMRLSRFADVEPLMRRRNRTTFDGGNQALNVFLRKFAGQNEDRGLSWTYLKYGFTALKDDKLHLYLPMSVIKKLRL